MPVESEHSVLSAAIASQATGARTFTASSSQGLMLMHEMHYVASGMRMPLVMANCSRGLSAPITLWSDHNDIMALRNSGWIMLFAKNNQEVLDSIILSFRIAEHSKVLLPAIVNMDGFILSFTREPTEVPEQKQVDLFLPPYKPVTSLDANRPISMGVPVMEGYMKFRSQVHKAHLNALQLMPKIFSEFNKRFGRKYAVVEKYKTQDADIVYVALGAMCTTLQAVVDSLRKKKVKAGLLQLRCLRPLPKKEISQALGNCKAVAVISNSLAPGAGGILYPEIKSVVPEKNVFDFIVSLGGEHISKKNLEGIGKAALKKKPGQFWML